MVDKNKNNALGKELLQVYLWFEGKKVTDYKYLIMNKKVKIKIIMILSLILTFLGCKRKQDLFLENNKVILCCSSIRFPDCELTTEANIFEKEHKISFSEASKIYTNFLLKKKEINSPSSRIIPTLIINENYVYSFKNLKTLQVAAFGVGINSNTGEIIHCDNRIWLYENDILKNIKASSK